MSFDTEWEVEESAQIRIKEEIAAGRLLSGEPFAFPCDCGSHHGTVAKSKHLETGTVLRVRKCENCRHEIQTKERVLGYD